MDDLPDESFALILDLVPIRDIFVLMRVSKRWAAACRFIVRTRQSLIIGNYDRFHWYPNVYNEMRGLGWYRNRPTEPLDNVNPANKSFDADMMKSLNQMENITRLCVYGSPRLRGISPFIDMFADQLTLLEVDFAISDVGSDVFPHLTHLKCRNFDAETAFAFPKLTDLVIHDPGKLKKQPDMRLHSLKRLIVIHPEDNQIKEFVQQNAANLEFLAVRMFRFNPAIVFKNLTDVSCGSMDVNMLKALPAIRRLTVMMIVTSDHNRGELRACAAVISEMRYLKELSFFVHLNSRIRMDASQILSRMFHRLHQLEKVSIRVESNHSYGNGDNIIFSLVQQNAQLRDVRFSGFNFTSAAYASLAQLQHLLLFNLDKQDFCVWLNQTTTDDVLTLLRGSLRKVIRKLTLWQTDVDVNQVTREIELMVQERGTTFEKREKTYFLEYKMHA